MRLRQFLVLSSLLFVTVARGESSPPPPDLASLLDKTNHDVSAYLEEFSNVTCTEHVDQEKLSPKGHVDYREEHTYDYFVILQGANDDLLLNESRVLKEPDRRAKKNTPLLISNGFSMLFLVFHPYYRNSFQFEREEDASVNGRAYMRVRFSHLRGSRTPAALAVRSREYPLDLVGEAWIDHATGAVSRISASLGTDMRDVGLRTLQADIEFAPVRLPGLAAYYEFPSTSTIEVETLRQHWKNVHHFTNYRRFTVSTDQSVADLKGTQ